MIHGIDVSSYQATSMIPRDVGFVIARATSGTRRDSRVLDHAARTRELGAQLGLYHFFFARTDPLQQARAYEEAADAARITAGCIVPFVDVEDYPIGGQWTAAGRVSPSWEPVLRDCVEAITETWGSCGLYLTQRDWTRLGSPSWVLDVPLWVAHWTAGRPATPGGVSPAIHQYRVGPWRPGAAHVQGEHAASNALDHNKAEALPIIQAHASRSVLEPTVVCEVDWSSITEERDRHVRDA
jgi:GH25 family lysozyme M1 (1,4-beta-N-acetylmuramidase)